MLFRVMRSLLPAIQNGGQTADGAEDPIRAALGFGLMLAAFAAVSLKLTTGLTWIPLLFVALLALGFGIAFKLRMIRVTSRW